jgi:hypothetical protein
VEPKRNSPAFLPFIIVTIIIIVGVYFLVVTFNTGDVEWFKSTFDGKPQEVLVHCFGSDVVLKPGDSNYDNLNSLINETLSQDKRWDPLTMSEITYHDYQTQSTMMVLEMKYAPAVRLHSNTKFFSNVDTLIIPLEGRHAQYNTVFGRINGNSTAGSFHVQSIAQLTEYLAAQGICKQP